MHSIYYVLYAELTQLLQSLAEAWTGNPSAYGPEYSKKSERDSGMPPTDDGGVSPE